MQSLQPALVIKATVKYAVDRIRQTKNGDRIKGVLTAPNGEEIELWDVPGAPLNYLKRGEQVSLTYDGKRYSLIATHPPQNGHQVAPSDAPTQASAQAPKSADVAEYVAIYEELKAALPGCSEQTWRAAASTLMMIRCKARGTDF